MGSRYLTDLAQVLINNGLKVKQYSGWQTRARGSGGYDSGRPTHIMVHHTASPPSADGNGDASYCAEGDEDAPLSNILLDRTGLVWVLAAGATNTNGSGRDTWGGGVPENSMNSYAIGIEAGNNGVGEPWPEVQQDAYIKMVRALMSHYNIPNNHVRAHFEWAPDRKTDPAGQSRWAGGSSMWNMTSFRSECGAATPAPTPPPTASNKWVGAIHDEGDPMFIAVKDGNYWIGNGLGRRELEDNDEVDSEIAAFKQAGTPLRNFNGGGQVTARSQVAGAQQLHKLGVPIS